MGRRQKKWSKISEEPPGEEREGEQGLVRGKPRTGSQETGEENEG